MESERLSKKKMIGFSFGAIPGALLVYLYNLYYVEFFYDDLKLLPLYFIVGQVIYAIVNAINDPLMGQLSDRTNRIRWGGRRIPYIKYGAPIWALTYAITWFPWSMDNQIIIFLQFIVSTCSFDTMLTLVILCWMALLPEMTAKESERNLVNFIVGVIGLFGLLPFIFLAPIFKKAGLQPFQFFNIVVAIISVICYWIVARVSKEKPEFQNDEVFPLWKSIKETLKLKSFLLFIGFNFFEAFNGSLGLTYLFAYSFVLGGDVVTITMLYFLLLIVIGYSSNIVCMKLRPKWGMRKIVLRFGLIVILTKLIFFVLILNPITESLIWIGIAISLSFGGYTVFNTLFMYSCMDEDEINQGTRREGMFLGANALITKPALSFGPILATVIFSAYGFVQNATIQSATAILGIKILFLLVPAIASSIGLVFMYFYPLHGEKLKILQVKLEDIHRQKREKLLNPNKTI